MQKAEAHSSKMAYRKPQRTFEDSGSVNPKESYYVPLGNVVNTKNQDIKTMVDRGRYFSIFAPRQSGKTTFLEKTRKQLHKDPTYVVIILSFQQYQQLEKMRFYELLEITLYRQLIKRLRDVNCDKTEIIEQFLNNHHLSDHTSFNCLFDELNQIIQFKKIVIFIDEFDGIPLSELANFLMVLRDLYQAYKHVEQKALYSVGLIGIRNITKLVVGGVSPFNIADQVDMPPFSLKNIRDLYAQYTAETNQPFTEEAVTKIHQETGGQTWLVNRIATILTVNIKHGTVEPINEQDVENALQMLVMERNVHFDNLDEKAKQYRETFVETVFDGVRYNPGNEEQTWLEQFGLVKNMAGKAVAANNIYKARYVNMFIDAVNEEAYVSPGTYVLADNRLDMEGILLDFDRYIAQIGVRAFYKDKKPYEKTGQFLLTAWLYQFVRNGEGDLRYEQVTGLGRMDIMLNYKGRKYIIETKVNHQKNIKRIRTQGIAQVAQKYLATESADEGFLVIFDTATHAGAVTKSKVYTKEEKRVTCFIIGIGYREVA